MQEEIQQQAGKLLGNVAGYVGMRTIEMGLSKGLFKEINRHPNGINLSDLAKNTNLDPFYVNVWANAAYASEVLELNGGGALVLAPHMDKLLLDAEFPGHVGAVFNVMQHPEVFDTFAKNFSSGKRTWWDEVSTDFIKAVSNTGRPFYNRLIPTAFAKVPGLEERLNKGANVLELCSGAGIGLEKLTKTYPNSTFTGQDGDDHSLSVAKKRLEEAGTSSKVSLLKSMMEDMEIENEFDVALINISMHESRDIDKVTQNVYRALKKDGIFIISDFPYPENMSESRNVPARIMSGIQYFEALIGDQLLPTKSYVELLKKHKFKNVAFTDISPVHTITWGTK
ncbi:MAG: methyltransferase domain-containing protein [Candidatus Aenigmatarchaeota archaeon]|nr:MAG: methyltransferase domain-containing protein [Candidatus Aenigmarchaeota archaeon]